MTFACVEIQCVCYTLSPQEPDEQEEKEEEDEENNKKTMSRIRTRR